MFEREGFVVLTIAQVKRLMGEIKEVTEGAHVAGFKEGWQAAEEAELEAFDAGYERGYSDGHTDGYMEGTDEFGDDWDEGYAEGHEAGFIEAELRCAENAAFEETPRIHSWIEGETLG